MLKLIKVDTKMLDHVTDQTLLSQVFESAGLAFGNLVKDGKANESVRLTLYSLYKQAKEGNADEFEKNKNRDPIKYAAWLQ